MVYLSTLNPISPDFDYYRRVATGTQHQSPLRGPLGQHDDLLMYVFLISELLISVV